MKKLGCLVIISTLVLSGCSKGIAQEDYDALLTEKETLSQQYVSTNDNYQALKLEKEESKKLIDKYVKEIDEYKKAIDEYEKIIEPYKNLSAAELSKKTNAANLKAKEDKIALAKIKKEETAEKAAAKKAAAEKKAAALKVGYNTGISFDQLARTPDKYEDKKVKFTGKVIQVMDGDSATQLRFAIDSNYDKVVYLEYSTDLVTSRILDDDIITIYGVSKGLLTYESTLGGEVTIPAILVDKIEQ